MSSSAPLAGSTGSVSRTASDGQLAPVAGGAVVNPHGTIRHAGYFFSLFRRDWSARLGNVPEVMLDVDDPRACPVGSEVQLIRRALVAVRRPLR